MLDREKRDHHESTPRRLPIQTPGQGTYGKQQSELDLAWALATPAAGAQLPGVIYEGRCGIQSLISDLLQEGLRGGWGPGHSGCPTGNSHKP